MDCVDFDVLNVALKLSVLMTEEFWHPLNFCASS